MSTLGAELRRLRHDNGLSLRALATQTGVSNPYLSQIERDEKFPSAKVLCALAEPLGVSEQYLLTRAGIIGKDTVSVKTSIETDPQLTTAQRAALLAVYQAFLASNNTEHAAFGQ
jgi:transcriptional regulator with XRE-family HTH domain